MSGAADGADDRRGERPGRRLIGRLLAGWPQRDTAADEHILALESELLLIREAHARCAFERARPPDPSTAAERLHEVASDLDGAMHGSDADWDALAAAATLREALLAACVELEQAAIRVRVRLEDAGSVLQAGEVAPSGVAAIDDR